MMRILSGVSMHVRNIIKSIISSAKSHNECNEFDFQDVIGMKFNADRKLNELHKRLRCLKSCECNNVANKTRLTETFNINFD